MVRRTAGDEAGFFVPHLRPGMRLLDVGSGPGSITLDLAAVVAPGEVVGLDIEPLQVERARTLAAERGATNVRFAVGDAYGVPFADGTFDAVFAHTVLMHLREPLAALKEFRRVLRPGGVVGIRDAADVPLWEPATPPLTAFRALHRRILEHARGRSADGFDFQQRRLLLAAGFARAEGVAQMLSHGTPETARQVSVVFADRLDTVWRPIVVEQRWAEAGQVDLMVAELRAWGERADSFGGQPWCAAMGWVDP